MNIAIVHYHLNRGGVTQVVLNHLWALHTLPDQLLPHVVLLLHGGQREGFPGDLPKRLPRLKIMEVVVPELDYDQGLFAKPQPLILADRIEIVLREMGCVAEDTLLHVHNHALGKNVSLPGAVAALADRQFGLLLQTHDFAEDFRPVNYRRLQKALAPDEPASLPGVLYPQAPQIHYAVLNRRDWSVLRDAGVDVGRLHSLPNPARPPESVSDRSTARQRLGERFGIEADDRYVLYPVRGIRRKNLGEALLWAAAAKPGTAFGFTLPPLNPIEQPNYIQWRSLAAELRLPCYFEVGGENGLSLADNLAACDCVLTTSLAEGFGLVFLETCLSHRALVGRDLPEITSDFVQRGMTFDGLQPRVDVPVEWIGRHELLDMLAGGYNSTLESYGRAPLSRHAVDEGLDCKLQNGCVDFGDLNANLQEGVIRKVSGNTDAMKTLVTINPFLRDEIFSNDAEYSAKAERNAAVATSRCSLEITARQLADTYQRVMASQRGPLSDLKSGEKILDTFLNLSRFRPVLL
jgi:hypothetical protein